MTGAAANGAANGNKEGPPEISHATRKGTLPSHPNPSHPIPSARCASSPPRPVHKTDHARHWLPRSEVPTILALIRELAEHENALASVLATEASLSATLCFAPAPGEAPAGPGHAKVLLLRLGARGVVGMALYFNNYSTWRGAPGVYLEDLYVREAWRGRGYGKLLVRALARETKRIGGARLEWCCLRCNDKSLAFYRGLGARQMEDWVTLRCDGHVLDDLAAPGEADAESGGDVVAGAD